MGNLKKNLKLSIFFLSEMSHSAGNVKGDPLGFINIHSAAKCQKNSKGEPFGDSKKVRKKVTQCRKKSKGGTL